MKKNSVYIGVSLDGRIADGEGGLDWLDTIEFPKDLDMGYESFMQRVDALVMGRTTFETVCSFDVAWPYTRPVFVLSTTLENIPESHQDKAQLLSGELSDVLKEIHAKGYKRLYIDGGSTIQSFLKEDLIDELIITTIPILLGSGPRLFAEHDDHLRFELIESQVFVHQVVQSHYQRKR